MSAYAVKIECPWCGRRVGRVVKSTGEPPRTLLEPGTRPGQCGERGCGGLEWPSADEVARAAERAQRKPHRPRRPYGGRTATLRARRVADVDLGNGGRAVLARGTTLGT